jgi:hypothetical protein
MSRLRPLISFIDRHRGLHSARFVGLIDEPFFLSLAREGKKKTKSRRPPFRRRSVSGRIGLRGASDSPHRRQRISARSFRPGSFAARSTGKREFSYAHRYWLALIYRLDAKPAQSDLESAVIANTLVLAQIGISSVVDGYTCGVP